MKGFDEVYNVLLEHSFRYFGPDSTITKRINDNNDWSPSINLDDNGLVRLIDENVRNDNCAYINFHYIGYYFIFDNLLTKIKKENKSNQLKQQNETKSTQNKNLMDLDELSLRFDQEELRKVMGFIGHLLVCEQQSLLDSSNYDYLQLYFQIKKVWSIFVTKRYLEDKMPIDEIKLKVKKSFAIQQLMDIEKAKIIIENYLSSFDDIYKTEESIVKHVNEFYSEFFRRYFCYIEIGLYKFLKDFLNVIGTKFTTIDLLKEYVNTLRSDDPFHILLIEFLQNDQSNSTNLQNEDYIKQFLDLVDAKYFELTGGTQNQELIDDSDELNPIREHNFLITDESYTINADDSTEQMPEDPNANLAMNLMRDENVLLNNNQQQLDDLSLGSSFTFSTMTEPSNNPVQPSAPSNETEIDQLETEIENPYQQIENIQAVESNPNDGDNQEVDNQEVDNQEVDNQEVDSQETDVSMTMPNSNENSDQSIEPVFNEPAADSSKKDDKSPIKSTTEKGSVEVARTEDDSNQTLTDLATYNEERSEELTNLSNLNENEDDNTADFHEVSNVFISNLNLIRSPVKAKKQRKETIKLIESDQDELGDLETIRQMETADEPTSTSLMNKPSSSRVQSASNKSTNLPKNKSPIIVKSIQTTKKPQNKSTKKRLKLVDTSSSEDDESKRIKLDVSNARKLDTIETIDKSQQEKIIERQPILKLRKDSFIKYNGKMIPIYN